MLLPFVLGSAQGNWMHTFGCTHAEGDVETLVPVVHICHQATNLGAIRRYLTHYYQVLHWYICHQLTDLMSNFD